MKLKGFRICHYETLKVQLNYVEWFKKCLTEISTTLRGTFDIWVDADGVGLRTQNCD